MITLADKAELPTRIGATTDGVLSKCVAALVDELPVEEIWVFGSHARAEANEDSDLDLLVVLSDGHGLARPNLAAFRAAAKIRHRPALDVIAIARPQWIFEQAHPFGLHGEIVRDGVRVYAR